MLTDNRELETKNNIIDVDLSVTNKQKFRINGNNDQILELNVSDMGIINRLSEAQPLLEQMANDAVELETNKIVAESEAEDNNEVPDSAIIEIGEKINKLDKQLREQIDYIFDSNVSEVCAPSGTMFDIFNGKLRYEHILDTLCNLYVDNIQSEYKRVLNRVESHTAKYTKKTTKKKK